MSKPRATDYGEDLAHVHHAGHGAHAERGGREVLRLLRGAGVRGGTLVDLACGSGIWPRTASAAGFDVLGVDPSSAMLRLARRVAPSARFVRASLYDFELPPCDAVTILGEGLNYLGAGVRPTGAFFRRVARALRPGGVLAFDALVDEGPPLAGRSWRKAKDWAVLVETRELRGGRIVEREITTFRRSGRAWRRTDELHRLRAFSRERVLRELETAGFEVEVADHYGRFALLPRRLAFFAVRADRAQGPTRC